MIEIFGFKSVPYNLLSVYCVCCLCLVLFSCFLLHLLILLLFIIISLVVTFSFPIPSIIYLEIKNASLTYQTLYHTQILLHPENAAFWNTDYI
jgi:hypothetical protein